MQRRRNAREHDTRIGLEEDGLWLWGHFKSKKIGSSGGSIAPLMFLHQKPLKKKKNKTLFNNKFRVHSTALVLLRRVKEGSAARAFQTRVALSWSAFYNKSRGKIVCHFTRIRQVFISHTALVKTLLADTATTRLQKHIDVSLSNTHFYFDIFIFKFFNFKRVC